jgi:hypothetical protein
MATADFEVRQLLKAYRKGLISDELFEAQMRELQTGGAKYVFNGKAHASEREMILHFLDEYRCAENFAAEYLNRWSEVSDQACVKGGLRAIQQRETYHAKLLEDRLRELGGICVNLTPCANLAILPLPNFPSKLLGRKGQWEFNEIVLSLQALAEELGRGAAFAGGFGHQPLSGSTDLVEKAPECEWRLKEHLEPLVSHSLEMPHEFEYAQFPPFLCP